MNTQVCVYVCRCISNRSHLQVELRHVKVRLVLVEPPVLQAVHLPPHLLLVVAEIYGVPVVKVHLGA